MKVAIIGNGLAGVTLASNLYNLDDSLDINIFSEEKHFYYSRVKLVDYIVGNIAKDELFVYDENWYNQRGITLHRNSSVKNVNTTKSTLAIETRDDTATRNWEYQYDVLVIASGSKPVIPDIPGKDKKGWHVLRNIEDADDIKEHLKQVERITILGSGALGLELANAFRSGPNSRDTSIIEKEPMVAPVYLDKQGATVFHNLLERAGVKILVKTEVTELVGDKTEQAGRPQFIEGCRLADKTIHKGDMVIFACGIKPNVDFLRNTPIEIIDGIVVNEFLQTNVKNVYAIGDCCEHKAFIYGINPAAIEQAKICAYNMVKPEGKPRIYRGTVPSVSFYGFGTKMVSLGRINEFTIDPDEYKEIYSYYKVDMTLGIYKKILLNKKHHVIGAILIGDLEQQLDLRRMILEEIDVSGFEESILQDGFSLREWI
ncbi:MAG: NAD(P)/FAD-dependent oxidoreductase [Candidatus Lokiarchaeota archaeon]|nr:NAD(P)/FAD-dependent oxidoreductase [Candidatus Lokiarchaeota archaeon]